jgi:putative transposase
MQCTEYPSSLSDEQWRLINKLFPQENNLGRRRTDRRLIMDAIMYWNRTGCQWRYIPIEFGPWQTVYRVYRSWVKDGSWICIHNALREKVRKQIVAAFVFELSLLVVCHRFLLFED